MTAESNGRHIAAPCGGTATGARATINVRTRARAVPYRPTYPQCAPRTVAYGYDALPRGPHRHRAQPLTASDGRPPRGTHHSMTHYAILQLNEKRSICQEKRPPGARGPPPRVAHRCGGGGCFLAEPGELGKTRGWTWMDQVFVCIVVFVYARGQDLRDAWNQPGKWSEPVGTGSLIVLKY